MNLVPFKNRIRGREQREETFPSLWEEPLLPQHWFGNFDRWLNPW